MKTKEEFFSKHLFLAKNKYKYSVKIVKQLLLIRDRNIKYRVVQSIRRYSFGRVALSRQKASTKRRAFCSRFLQSPKNGIVKELHYNPSRKKKTFNIKNAISFLHLASMCSASF